MTGRIHTDSSRVAGAVSSVPALAAIHAACRFARTRPDSGHLRSQSGHTSLREPKFTSRADPAAQWTGAQKGHAFLAYATNYLIDTNNAIIVDVETTRAIRQAEVGAARTMIDRTMDRFGLYPERLIADSAYGSAPMLGWLVEERGIEPHIPVVDKSGRSDGTLERADFA